MEELQQLAKKCTHRGDMPSQILPRLYLSGHPGRYNAGAARACAANPTDYMREKHAVKLMVNCAAGKSLSLGIIETSSGEKHTISDLTEFMHLIQSPPGDPKAEDDGAMFHLNLPLDDIPEFDLMPFLDSAVQCIEACLLLGSDDATSEFRTVRSGVLVFCQMGVSRSASIVCAYLMKRSKASAAHVIDFLQSRRQQVDPNEGFRSTLKRYEAIISAL